MLIMHVLSSCSPFLANNTELAVLPSFWPVNCIKIGGHFELLSDFSGYLLFCGVVLM